MSAGSSMAAALGGLGLLHGRFRLAAAAAATSSALSPRAPVRGGAATFPSAGRNYGSEAKEEEELRVQYLDEEHKVFLSCSEEDVPSPVLHGEAGKLTRAASRRGAHPVVPDGSFLSGKVTNCSAL